MTRHLTLHALGPAVTVQDGGRSGGLGLGLSRGGAADRHAFLEGCALLGQTPEQAALELAGFGGTFEFSEQTRFALTGAKMRATLDGQPLEWAASHLAEAGAHLQIGAAENGVYGYLSLGGGLTTETVLGGRGYHGTAGLGPPLAAGDRLPLGKDHDVTAPSMRLGPKPSQSGPLRIMPGPQTDLFPDAARQAFVTTEFTRSPKANRQGVRLDHDGAPFSSDGQLNRVSDFIAEGDVQMTGDGTPYVLLADCQTIGGYPRIGTVLPVDLPRVAQALPGAKLSFGFVTPDEAEALWQSDETRIAEITKSLQMRTRDPREMSDLLTYELISKPIES